MSTPSSPSPPRPERVQPSRTASVVFGVLDLVTAAAVLGLMRILWSSSEVWHVALGVWAALLLLSAVGLFSGTRTGRVFARVASFFQLGFLAALVLGVLSSVAYLWGVYGQIGQGVSVVMLLLLGLMFEFMGLLPVFKLRSLGMSEGRSSAHGGKVGLSVMALSVTAVALVCASARASGTLPSWEPLPPDAREAMSDALMAVLDGEPPGELPDALGGDDDRWVIRVLRRGRVQSRIEVTGNLREATQAAATLLEGKRPRATGDRSIAIDRVVAESSLEGRRGVLGALSIVPGLDGVSGEVEDERVTVSPHEIVTQRMLSEYTPIPFIQDFEIGADPDHVRAVLCKTAQRPEGCEVRDIRRARTESWVTDSHGTRSLYRSRPVADRPVTPDDAFAGAVAAGNYVLRSLRRDGRFQYKFFPTTGRREMEPYNVPRHAGTTWFLLELYEATGKAEFLRGAESALDWLDAQLRDCGDGLRCIGGGDRAGLGPQALPLIALSAHARLADPERYGDTRRQLADVVMRLQREDGDFDFALDTATGQPIEVSRQLYAGGQAALGLALSGQVDDDDDQLIAARRALDFMAGPYWDFFVSDLFFIEEHWTCLAADELHKLYGDEDHARLCVAAAEFDLQLQHGTESVFPDYVGGIGFTPFFPPYTTTAAGRGEGLIAAYRISRRQGQPNERLLRGIRDAVGFLVHNQYKRGDTYAFRNEWSAVGGVPWNYYDPVIRIDTVQHTGSMMLHGSEFLREATPN